MVSELTISVWDLIHNSNSLRSIIESKNKCVTGLDTIMVHGIQYAGVCGFLIEAKDGHPASCRIHDSKPQHCRDFPRPGDPLPAGCGYIEENNCRWFIERSCFCLNDSCKTCNTFVLSDAPRSKGTGGASPLTTGGQ